MKKRKKEKKTKKKRKKTKKKVKKNKKIYISQTLPLSEAKNLEKMGAERPEVLVFQNLAV